MKKAKEYDLYFRGDNFFLVRPNCSVDEWRSLEADQRERREKYGSKGCYELHSVTR